MANLNLANLFHRELIDLVGFLIEESLVDSQNVPAVRERGNDIVVLQSDYWDADDRQRMMRKIPYVDLHAELRSSHAYDLKLLDGALVQFQYEFGATSGELLRSRTAFLPSPILDDYQSDPELYLLDEVYGEVVDLRTVTVPIRADFDSREGVADDLHHPVSHITIGQYPHCRLPVASAITPYYFMEFILRCFYRTPEWLCTDHMPGPRVALPSTITQRESSLLHVNLPLSV